MDIYIDHLVKEYGNRRVLDMEKLRIREGSLCGIIGPNGAGKSTLIKILGGLEEPTRGKVLYNHKPFREDLYKNMSVVFQKPYLLRRTVYENIAYPLLIRKENKKSIDQKVNEILEEMGLQELKDKKSWTLSGGEAQKVALARAVVFKPSLLMLDEPTANIDPSSIAIMEKMIQKINEQEKTTVMIITHNLQQAKRLCKEVVFIHNGKIHEFGEGEKVIFQPQNNTTKKFIQGELLF